MDGIGTSSWLEQYPEIAAVIILLAGVLLAFILRNGVALASSWLNRVSERKSVRAGPVVSARFIRALQLLVFWGLILAVVIKSVSLLGGPQTVMWDGLWRFAGRIFVALSIIAAGHVLGFFARNLVNGLARHPDLSALPVFVYALIFGISLVMALAHIGLDVTLITLFALVVVTVFLASLGLAFALGARTLVANLTAQGELARYRHGDRLRIDGTEGVVLEIDRTGLVLSTTDGVARVPAARLAESTVVVLTPGVEDDG